MRVLWTSDGASLAGEFVKFDKVSCNPKPVAKSVPIIVGGHSEAAARRAGRLGDGFFPSIGAQVDTVPLLDVARHSAEQAGRDPAMVESILGCPGALPNSGSDPRAAVEERIARGAGRLALPVTAFLPDLETTLARFGEEIIRPYANA
jgi:alkanesulfonate monooxygenase SsuD/methylene tetrahydromethanopterin reductase-like flavin-dependent oxidoreductase (luciferase family)